MDYSIVIHGQSKKLLRTYPPEFIQRYKNYIYHTRDTISNHILVTVNSILKYDKARENCGKCVIFIQFVNPKTNKRSIWYEKCINLHYTHWFRDLCQDTGVKDIVNKSGRSISSMTREDILSCNQEFFAYTIFSKDNYVVFKKYNKTTKPHLVEWWRMMIQSIQEIIVNKLLDSIQSGYYANYLNSGRFDEEFNDTINTLLSTDKLYKQYGCSTFEQFVYSISTKQNNVLDAKIVSEYLYHELCVPIRYTLINSKQIFKKYIKLHNKIAVRDQLKSQRVTDNMSVLKSFVDNLTRDVFHYVGNIRVSASLLMDTIHSMDHHKTCLQRNNVIQYHDHVIQTELNTMKDIKKITDDPLRVVVDQVAIPYYYKLNKEVNRLNNTINVTSVDEISEMIRTNPLTAHTKKCIADTMNRIKERYDIKKETDRLIGITSKKDGVEPQVSTKTTTTNQDCCLKYIVCIPKTNQPRTIRLKTVCVVYATDGSPLLELHDENDSENPYQFIDPLNSKIWCRDGKCFRMEEVHNSPDTFSYLYIYDDVE